MAEVGAMTRAGRRRNHARLIVETRSRSIEGAQTELRQACLGRTFYLPEWVGDAQAPINDDTILHVFRP